MERIINFHTGFTSLTGRSTQYYTCKLDGSSCVTCETCEITREFGKATSQVHPQNGSFHKKSSSHNSNSPPKVNVSTSAEVFTNHQFNSNLRTLLLCSNHHRLEQVLTAAELPCLVVGTYTPSYPKICVTEKREPRRKWFRRQHYLTLLLGEL